MTALKALIVTLVASSVLGGPAGDPAPTGAGRAALPPLPFDHILRYDELTKRLDAWAAARPDIVQLESLGLTPGGRKMWFLTLTNRATGPASEKPALVVDGNMHATEWGGGVAALHVVRRLLRDDCGARLVSGDLRRSLGQLAGRTAQRSTATWWGYTPGTPDRAVADWLVAAPAGTTVSVTASHDRAGTVRGKVVLGAAEGVAYRQGTGRGCRGSVRRRGRQHGPAASPLVLSSQGERVISTPACGGTSSSLPTPFAVCLGSGS